MRHLTVLMVLLLVTLSALTPASLADVGLTGYGAPDVAPVALAQPALAADEVSIDCLLTGVQDGDTISFNCNLEGAPAELTSLASVVSPLAVSCALNAAPSAGALDVGTGYLACALDGAQVTLPPVLGTSTVCALGESPSRGALDVGAGYLACALDETPVVLAPAAGTGLVCALGESPSRGALDVGAGYLACSLDDTLDSEARALTLGLLPL